MTGKSAAGHVGVIKLNANGSRFLVNRELSGTGQEEGNGIALDIRGNVILVGMTTSSDYPVSTAAFQRRLAGPQNVFVTKLDASGSTLFSTYLGGSGIDAAYTVQTDAAGNIFVGGSTTSLDFPTTAGSFQPSPVVPMWATSPGGFVVKLQPDGSSLSYGTYFMSCSAGSCSGLPGGVQLLALSSAGEVYLTGATGPGFPVTASAPQPCFGGFSDVFVAHLDSLGELKDATYFGGTSDDYPVALALDGDGSIMVVASTSGPAFARIRFGDSGWTAPACMSPDLLNAATLFGNMRVSAGQISTLVGFGIGPDKGVWYEPDLQGKVPLSLDGVQVFFDDQPAPLLYVQSRQVNLVAPFELSGRTSTTVRLAYKGATFGPFDVPVTFANPAFFRLHAGISAQAAAINQDGTINTSENPARQGSVVALYGTGFGLTDPPCSTGALNAPIAVNLASGVAVALNGDSPGSPQVQYAGGAPGLLCGVAQINMVVPHQTPAGVFELVPLIEMRTQNSYTAVYNMLGATIAVK
jgi:uncharacterized protein (TIGR03437 family)